MNWKKYEFHNFPKKLELKDYKKAVRKIIDSYSGVKGLKSIYEWGSVSVPGISDIDLVLVFEKNAKNLPFLRRSFHFFNKETKNIVYHPFIIIDEESFKDIKYVYPDTNLEHLHGKDISIKNLGRKEKYYASVALLNDIIIRHYPRDFALRVVNKRIDVRNSLLRLNSLTYTLKTLENITNNKNRHWDDFSNRVKKVRNGWFEKRDLEELVKLLEDTIGICFEVTKKFSAFLSKEDLVKARSTNKVVFHGEKNKSVFVKNWEEKNSWNNIFKEKVRNKNFYVTLPLNLCPQIFEYSKNKGIISDYIRKNISGKIDNELKYRGVVDKRIEVFNQQAELDRKLKYSGFSAFYDFGYRNSRGVNNWALKVLDYLKN